MPGPPYRGLRIVLGFFSLLAAVAGVLMVFGGKGLILRAFLYPPEAQVSTLLLFLIKEMGGAILMFSVLLFLTSRDPERNVAVVDAVIVGMCILAVTPLLALRTTEIGTLYPGPLIWGRSVVRLAVAGVLLYLRPRRATQM